MRLTILAPLRHRNFRLLFIGQAISMIGNQPYFVALPFQILALHAARCSRALTVLRGSAATYGVIGAAAGLGEVAGGLLVGNLHFKNLLVGTYIFSALLGLSFAIYGIAPLLPVVLVGGFAFSLCIVASNTHWDSALQKHVPPNLIGRVTSVDYFGSYLVGPIAPVIAAAALDRIGPSLIFVIGGAITFVYWVVAMAILRPDRDRAAGTSAGTAAG